MRHTCPHCTSPKVSVLKGYKAHCRKCGEYWELEPAPLKGTFVYEEALHSPMSKCFLSICGRAEVSGVTRSGKRRWRATLDGNECGVYSRDWQAYAAVEHAAGSAP